MAKFNFSIHYLTPSSAIFLLYICAIHPAFADMVQPIPPLAEFAITNLSSAGAENPGSDIEVSGQENDLMGNFARKDISLGNLIIEVDL